MTQQEAKTSLETKIHSLLSYKRPVDVYNALLCKIDQESWERVAGKGRLLARKRSELHDFFVQSWCADILHTSKIQEEYALVAHGGYGRSELVPNSDVDVMLLVENIVSNENPLVYAFEEGIKSFGASYGFQLKAGVNNFANIRGLTTKDVNSFLDMRYLAGSAELAARFRNQIQQHHENHELFFHNLSLWERTRQAQTEGLDDIRAFNIKNGQGGLRNFQTGVWIRCIPEFLTSETLYKYLEHSDPVTLESLDVLLAVRSWINLSKEGKRIRQAKANKQVVVERRYIPIVQADVLQREDFLDLGEEWREKLLSARHTVECFTSGIIAKELKDGVPLGKFLHTIHGLYWPEEGLDSNLERRTQSFFTLIRETQRRGISIDKAQYQSTLHNIASWIRPHQGFVDLFEEAGSLATSLDNLSSLGVLGKVIPSFTQLETAIPEVNHRAQHLTSAGFARQKITVLEQLIGEESPYPYLSGEYNTLRPEHRSAVKLALLVKRIPTFSPECSGVTKYSPREYMEELKRRLPFSDETLSMTEFLLINRDLLINSVRNTLNDAQTVRSFASKVGTKERLRALVLFTYGDRGRTDNFSEAMHIWKSIDELHHKTMNFFTGSSEGTPYDPRAFDAEEANMDQDLGKDFKSSIYAPHTSIWIPRLVQVYKNHTPIIKSLRDPSVWGIACQDYGGLMAVITGEHYRLGLNVQQAYAYVLSQHKLALSFFGLEGSQSPPKDYDLQLASAITERRFIELDPDKVLAPISRRARIDDTAGCDLYRLSFETDKDAKGILYALTRILHERLNADIYGIKAHVASGKIDDYLFFKTPLPLEEARALVAQYIGKPM